MASKYLLYIDILGFKDLVTGGEQQIKELYEIINNLNVHRHDAFTTIVFSDTILVTNKHNLTDDHSHNYHVMYCCEFVQDLLHRLQERSSPLQFRAILTYDEFEYYRLSNIECYFGNALVNAYLKEMELNGIGLFMDKRLCEHNLIFPTIEYSKDLVYVFLTSYFQILQFYTAGELPLPSQLIETTSEFDGLPADIALIKYYFDQAKGHPSPKVRAKYLQTYQFFRSKYAMLISKLEEANFSMSVINSEVKWRQITTTAEV